MGKESKQNLYARGPINWLSDSQLWSKATVRIQELTEVQEAKKVEEVVDASPKRLLKLISDYRTEVE